MIVDFPDLDLIDDDDCDCLLCPPPSRRRSRPKPTSRRELLRHLHEKHDRVFHDARWITLGEVAAIHAVLHEA